MSDPRARRAVSPPFGFRSRVRARPVAGPRAGRRPAVPRGTSHHGPRRAPRVENLITISKLRFKSKPFGSRPTYPAPHDAEPARIAAGARRPITKPVAGRSAAASTRDTAGSHDSRPGLAMIVQVTRRPFPGCGSRHRRPWSGHGAVPRRRRKSALAAPSYPLRSAHSIERIEWPTSYRKYQERRLLVSLVARAPPCLPHATPHQPSGACWAPT